MKENKIMKTWKGQGAAASRITRVREANSGSAIFLVHRVFLVSLVPIPELRPCFVVLSDLGNEAEKLSKGKTKCFSQKAKNKIFPIEFVGFGNVEIFG